MHSIYSYLSSSAGIPYLLVGEFCGDGEVDKAELFEFLKNMGLAYCGELGLWGGMIAAYCGDSPNLGDSSLGGGLIGFGGLGGGDLKKIYVF